MFFGRVFPLMDYYCFGYFSFLFCAFKKYIFMLATMTMTTTTAICFVIVANIFKLTYWSYWHTNMSYKCVLATPGSGKMGEFHGKQRSDFLVTSFSKIYNIKDVELTQYDDWATNIYHRKPFIYKYRIPNAIQIHKILVVRLWCL